MFDIATQLYIAEDICLGPINYETDPEIESKWTHDAGFMRLYDFEPARPMSAAKLEKQMDEKRDMYHFMVRAKVDDRLIGKAAIQRIEWANGNCQIKLGVGAEEDRRQGYGSQAMRLLIRFAFAELNMFRITAEVGEYNDGGIALLTKFGFVEEVRRRKALERDGRRWDLIGFGLLKDEWLDQTRA